MKAAGLALALLVVATPAAADAPSQSDHDLALALFKHSDEAYKRGDFRGAVSDLEKAYSLEAEPILLYNLGRAYEGLGDTKNAIDAYDRYLKAKPDADDRGAIEARLTTLRHQLELERHAQAPVVTAQAPPIPVKARPLAPAPIVVTTIGAVGVVTGAVLGIVALSVSSSQNAPQTSQVDAQNEHDTASGLATGANVAYIAGGIVALAGIVWIIIDRATAPNASPRAFSTPFVLRF